MRTLLFLVFLMGCEERKLTTDDYFNEICMRNHVYLVGTHKLAIRLDDNGKPLRCITGK